MPNKLLTVANGVDLEAARIGFHAAFMTSLEAADADPAELLYTEVPSTAPVEEWNWLGDLPQFEEWKDERKYAQAKGYRLRVENKNWSSGLKVHQNDIKDDRLGLYQPFIDGMARKARRHRGDLMIKFLINGFDGAAYPDLGNGLGYDGAFFFSDAHEGGNDNKLTLALDAAGLEAAELLLESMTTYDGEDPLDTHGTHLIVGPSNRTKAEKLLTQERLANGEDNIHRGKYQLIVSPRIRGAHAGKWFLVDLSQPIKPCLLQMREEISTSAIVGAQGSRNDSESRMDTGFLKFGAEARYNAGYFEHRLAVGSTGA